MLKQKLIRIVLGTFFGLWVVSFFYYIDFEEACVIKMKPGVLSLIELNHSNIRKGIKVLKYAEPEIYNGICDNIDVISSDIGCGGWQGGCHYGKAGKITLSTTKNEFLGWTAAIIVHEYCHDLQIRSGRPISEDECYKFDHDILQSVVDVYD